MNQEELILEQYKLYCQQKDAFIDRSFSTNKFYLLLVVALILMMYFTKDMTFSWGLSSTIVFSVIGMLVCILWWSNMDSYNMLTKVKFASVIEEIEKQLPVKPFQMEFSAIKDYRNKKKMFMFQDIQKSFALLVLLMFMVLFITNVIPAIMGVNI